jgi:hypothetical protein
VNRFCAREPKGLEPEIGSDPRKATGRKMNYLICLRKHPGSGGALLGILLPTELFRNRDEEVYQVHPSWLHRDPRE